ncbi:hypothetical protein DVT68_07360 [Dyella solisilvae]|uniref:Uncharacterized protein n=1 Tax=Dyella solisilvae TaxID=1920168 RepID=A0A370K6S1_9GAMM|nr:hypothetical protein DVT68_07360 [Dyella solisilvae]
MATSAHFPAEWQRFDPDALERLVQVRDGFVLFEDMEAVAQATAPGLEEAFWGWGRGVTVSEAGIPVRDWRAFLGALRRARTDRR